MSSSFPLITADLEREFQKIKRGVSTPPPQARGGDIAGGETPYELPPSLSVSGAFGAHHNRDRLTKTAAISTGQPSFFSPVYTPINWQIPSKRREVYMWSRYFYENEPRVAAAVDFYARFPMASGFDLECEDRHIKKYYEELCDSLDLLRWFRLINHEVHLLGDCFPFLEVDCPTCKGSGWISDGIACEHEGGSFKRIVIMNPDFVEVFTNPILPDNAIALVPDDELRDIVKKGGKDAERLAPNVRDMVMQGQPIPLDNLSVSHLRFGESGYRRYGISMIRRLFPILSYKTKLMTAQWIVAERMILPVKIVKVGTEERPASPMDIANVQEQLQATSNDPNLVIVTHHAFDLQWVGAGAQVLQLSQEWEFINQEILAGLGINQALLNAEGPVYSSAAIGAEIMIQKLEHWRMELAKWAQDHIFLPVAKMRGFVKEDEWGQKKYVIPKIKWKSLNLRDIDKDRQTIIQLFDKGLISRRRVLEEFDIDADVEAEQIRYERIEAMSEAGPGDEAGGGMGGGGGLEGAFGGGGGGLDLGGGDMGGADMGGADMGGADMGGGAGGVEASQTASAVNIKNYGGKVLKEKSRTKIDRNVSRSRQMSDGGSVDDGSGFERDEKGRIYRTSLEISLHKGLMERARAGRIKHKWISGLEIPHSPKPYLIDIAFPSLKIDVEADGETFHSTEEQMASDRKRDDILRNKGWIVLRFSEREIKDRLTECLDRIETEIAKKEEFLRSHGKNNKK